MSEKICKNCKHFGPFPDGEGWGDSGLCNYFNDMGIEIPAWVHAAFDIMEPWQGDECVVWRPKPIDTAAAKR